LTQNSNYQQPGYLHQKLAQRRVPTSSSDRRAELLRKVKTADPESSDPLSPRLSLREPEQVFQLSDLL